MNTELLFCVSIGVTRANKYFKTFLVDGNHDDPKRSEKESEGGVSLKKIDTTQEENEKDFSIDMERIGFLNEEEIKKAYTAKEMKDEWKYLNSELEKIGMEPVKRNPHAYSSYTKAAYASCMAKARLQLLDADEDFLEKRKTELWEKNDMKRMAKDRDFSRRVANELSNEFFCFRGVKAYEELKRDHSTQCYTFEVRRSNIRPPMNENLIIAGGNQQEQIVLDDSPSCDERRNANTTSARESLGGTNLFANMF